MINKLSTARKISMSKKLIVGNWKMNKNLAEAVSFIQVVAEPISDLKQVEAVVCPPYLWIPVLDGLLRNSKLQLGSQDISAWKNGAYTGQISGAMLAPHCQYAIIGHSERRRLLGETPQQVNGKIKQALEHKIQPIICVSDLSEVDAIAELDLKTAAWIIAYEPLSAIGSGQPSDPQQVKQMVSDIKKRLGKTTQILYGGSVTPENIAQYTALCHGALVGGASLDPQSFIQLCQSAT